jgi:hypothetical protein
MTIDPKAVATGYEKNKGDILSGGTKTDTAPLKIRGSTN